MAFPDPHDPRMFEHYLKLNADGTVAARIEIAVGEENALIDDPFVFNITKHGRLSVDDITIEKTKLNKKTDAVKALDLALKAKTGT